MPGTWAGGGAAASTPTLKANHSPLGLGYVAVGVHVPAPGASQSPIAKLLFSDAGAEVVLVSTVGETPLIAAIDEYSAAF